MLVVDEDRAEDRLALLNAYKTFAGRYDYRLLLLAVATLLVAILTIKRLFSSKSTRQRQIILTGPSGAGKTAIFTKLVLGHATQSHSSISDNKGRLYEDPMGKSASRLLIDTPGHPRLRARSLAANLSLAANSDCALILDAATGLTARTIKDAADHLQIIIAFSILQPGQSQSRRLLICLNKEDLLPSTLTNNASNKNAFIERSKLGLAREMERRRMAATSAGVQQGSKVEALSNVAGTLKSRSASSSLPSDEVEIMQVDIWTDKGPWQWESTEDCPFKVEWMLFSATASTSSQIVDNTEHLRRWINSN